MRKEIEIILEKLTLEEKARLMVGVDSWHTQAYPDKGLGAIAMSDGPNGIRKEIPKDVHAFGLEESYPATCLPSLSCLSASFDPDAALLFGAVLGKEAQSMKVQVVLGPGLNIKRNPLGGRNFEYLSEDPYLAGMLGAQFVRGVQSNGISACIKHYCVNSQETRRMTVDSVVDERTLREIYTMPFEIVTKEVHVGCVMSSYNLVNGTYANENHHTMVDILRDECQYKGMVVTDWGGEHDRIKGLECFNSLEMPTSGDKNVKAIIQAVEQGKLSRHVLDQNVAYLIDLYLKTKDAVSTNNIPFDQEKDHEIAIRIAEDCLVLLKNDNAVLPLAKDTKVGLFGDYLDAERIQGAGSSRVNPTKTINVKTLFKASPDIHLAFTQKGFDRLKDVEDPSLIDTSVWATMDTAVVFMGLDEQSEAEGKDRLSLAIHRNQIELLKKLRQANKKVVAVVFSGSAIDMSFDQYCDAVLFCYLPGQGGNEAILNILTGKCNPSGHLAETFFRSLEAIPSTQNFARHELTSEYREGLYVGYRYGLSHPEAVRYPFGYGLSYTTFAYSDLRIDDEGISVHVKNTGAVKGRASVQMYIGLPESGIYRPKYELKGFTKVTLDPGQEDDVRIPFDAYSFRYYDVSLKAWKREGGDYEILVGQSSQDIVLRGTVHKDGDATPKDADDLACYRNADVMKVSDKAFRTLLGHEIPPSDLARNRHGKVTLTPFAIVQDLKHSKGLLSKPLYRLLVKKARQALSQRDQANLESLLHMVDNSPILQLGFLSGGVIGPKQCEGVLEIGNGHLFKGIRCLLSRK